MDVKIPIKRRPETDFQFKYLHKATQTRFNSIAGGRRIGKTMISVLWLFIMGFASTDGVNVYIAPTMRQAKKVGLRQMLMYIAPNFKYKWNGQDSILSVLNHEFMFASSDNIDAIRGFKIANALFTEAAFQKEEMWTEIVRPALADLKGHALLESTYNGYNWFWKTNTQHDRFNSVCWPTTMNPFIDAEEIEEMKATMSEDVFKQEILAIPTTAQGLVFGNTFDAENIIDPVNIKDKLNDGFELFVSIDYGYNDPTAVGVFLVKKHIYLMPTVIKIHEIVRRKMLIDNVMAELLEWFRVNELEPKGVTLTCDAAGKQHTGASHHTYISKIEDLKLFRVLYQPNRDKLKVINMIRAHLKNAVGKRNYMITRNNEQTIEAYTTYEIKDRERPFDDSKIDHIPDSDGYLFLNVIADMIPDLFGENKKTANMRLLNCQICHKEFLTRSIMEICEKCKTEITGIAA